MSATPPIVLVHGFRGAPAGLEAIAKQLRHAGHKVYVPAIPPFAGAPTLASYTPEAYVEYLVNYLSVHHIERPILVGHSMGSVIVSAMAKLRPDLIDNRLVLLSPIATTPAWPFRMVSPLAAIVPRTLVDYITTRFLFVPKDHTKFKQTMAITHTCSADQPPAAHEIAKATRFSVSYNIYDFLPQQKTLIIAGEKDRLVGKRNIERLAQTLDTQTKFITGTGHLHNYEDPDTTARLIMEFLQPKPATR